MELKPYEGSVSGAKIDAVIGGLVYKKVSATTDVELDLLLTAELNTMADRTARFMEISTAANMAVPASAWLIMLFKNQNSAFVVAESYGSEVVIQYTRARVSGAWGDWCNDTPYYQTNVEYKTRERYAGASVYTMLVECGTMPDSTTKTVAYPNSIAPSRIIRLTGRLNNNQTIPCYASNGTDRADLYADLTGITLKTTSNAWASRSAYVQVWYTKD